MPETTTIDQVDHDRTDAICFGEEQVMSNVSRRDFLAGTSKLVLGGALAATGVRSTTAQAAVPTERDGPLGTRPNILLIINDQERYPQHWPADWAADNLPAHTQLADNGLTFRHAFCNTAMCSPSRATLFTGLHPAQHTVTRTLTGECTTCVENTPVEPTLPPGIQTMGHMLGSAGYNVVLKGKWHMTMTEDYELPSSENVASYGFNDWVPTAVADDTNPDNFGGGCADWDATTTEQAINFLQTQSAATTAEQPFTLIVGLGNPHDVLSYPNSWNQPNPVSDDPSCDNYADFDFDLGITVPETAYTDQLLRKPTCQRQVLDLMAASLGTLVSEGEQLNYVNFYAGLIKQVDAQIGQIMDAVPEDIYDNTIIIFASDHGEMGLAHGGLRQKAFVMYEEAVNVPLIIHNPTLFPTGQTTNAYASLIDLMPTLATLAQVPDPQEWVFFGTDLSPLLTAPDEPVQNEILFTFDDTYAAAPCGPFLNPVTGQEIPAPPKNIRAIFTQDPDGEWKYARYFEPCEEGELCEVEEQYEMYHLYDGDGNAVDPIEEDNLAHPTSVKGNTEPIKAKRAQLAARLAVLEQERLQPLSGSGGFGGKSYLPFIQS